MGDLWSSDEAQRHLSSLPLAWLTALIIFVIVLFIVASSLSLSLSCCGIRHGHCVVVVFGGHIVITIICHSSWPCRRHRCRAVAFTMGIASSSSSVATLLSVVRRGHVVIVIVTPWHSPWASRHHCLRWPHCRHRRLSSIVATSSLSSHHGRCVCMIRGHHLPRRPPHPRPHPCPRPPHHCCCRPHRLCPHPPRCHRQLCCHGHHIVIIVVQVLVLVPLSLSSVNAEGGWWLHYRHKWQGCRRCPSMQREGGGCVIDAGGRVIVVVVVVIHRYRGGVVAALLMQVAGWSSLSVDAEGGWWWPGWSSSVNVEGRVVVAALSMRQGGHHCCPSGAHCGEYGSVDGCGWGTYRWWL